MKVREMQLDNNNDNKHSITHDIYASLENMIITGEVAVGDKIPTEAAICDEYGVGRSTVREAIRMLQAKGYVEVKRGSGTYVVSRVGDDMQSITKWIMDNKESIRDYMDVRIAIESLSVKLFIQRGDAAVLNQIQQIEEKFERAELNDDLDMLVACDEEFHKAIVDGIGNNLLSLINEYLIKTFRKYRFKTFAILKYREAAKTAHRNIFDALNRRDTNDALYFMQNHLTDSLNNAVKLTQNLNEEPPNPRTM